MKKKDKKSENKGLPGHFIKAYGTPMKVQLISRQTWDDFYTSEAGRQRATAMMNRYETDNAARQISINDVGKEPIKNDKATLAKIVTDNASAKANARKRKVVHIPPQ